MNSRDSIPSEMYRCFDRFKHGDPHAIEEFLAFLRDKLREPARHCRRSKPSVERNLESSDLIQEALMALFSVVQGLESASHAFATALTILQNKSVSLLRYHTAQKRDCGRLESQSIHMIAQNIPDEKASRTKIEERILCQEIAQIAIDRLSDRDRQIIDLLYVQGLSEREIAEFLDIPFEEVRRRLIRAAEKLADILGLP